MPEQIRIARGATITNCKKASQSAFVALSLWAIGSATIAANPVLTPVFCSSAPGNPGVPESGFCDFLNKQGNLCLHFGENAADLKTSTLLGGAFDNTKSLPLTYVTITAKNYTATAGNYLIVYLDYTDTKHKTTAFAYAFATAASTKTKLANGDTQLRFNPSAFSAFDGVPLNNPVIQALEIGTTDSRYYPPQTYLIYGATVNGKAVNPNTAQGGPRRDCTF